LGPIRRFLFGWPSSGCSLSLRAEEGVSVSAGDAMLINRLLLIATQRRERELIARVMKLARHGVLATGAGLGVPTSPGLG
jgi:hypothetical protein